MNSKEDVEIGRHGDAESASAEGRPEVNLVDRSTHSLSRSVSAVLL